MWNEKEERTMRVECVKEWKSEAKDLSESSTVWVQTWRQVAHVFGHNGSERRSEESGSTEDDDKQRVAVNVTRVDSSDPAWNHRDENEHSQVRP